MFWEQPVQYASQSDVGLRRGNNEDALVVQIQREEATFASHGHLFVMADGMGGHAVGELASKLAIETVPLAFYKSKAAPAEALQQAIEEANRVIFERGSANDDFRRMGTTCSTLLLSPAGAIVGHVGDSRVYRVRDHRIDQLTFDHSLQWELRRQTGRSVADIEENEPRNVITRSLGPEATVKVDVEGPFGVAGGDVYVLCSDGLNTHLTDEEIGAAARYLPAPEACRLLVNLALLRGGTDNVSVIVLEVGSPPDDLPQATTTTLPVARSRGGASWVGYASAVACLLAGLLLATVGGWWDAGSALGVLGVVFGVATIFRRIRAKAANAAGTGDPAATVIWRPHASASAQLTRRFVEGMKSLDEELAQVAREEEWTVEWSEHAAAAAGAATAYRAKNFPEAFAGWSRSISFLVGGIVERRRKMQHEARWGSTPTVD